MILKAPDWLVLQLSTVDSPGSGLTDFPNTVAYSDSSSMGE